MFFSEKKKVFHLHDRMPAETLFAKEAQRGVTPGRLGSKGKDFRSYDFPEGDFPVDGKAVSKVKKKERKKHK